MTIKTRFNKSAELVRNYIIFITMALMIAAISALKNDCDIMFHAHTKGAKKIVDTLFGDDKTLKYKASKMTMDLEF